MKNNIALWKRLLFIGITLLIIFVVGYAIYIGGILSK